MKNSLKKQNKGFTLIEIMVTVAIVGIFASIALPSFSNLIESNRINTGANELVSNLLLARSEALKRRNNVTMCPSDDQANCSSTLGKDFSQGWVLFTDCNGDGDIDPAVVDGCGDEVIKVSDGFDTLYMTNRSVQTISFGFSGRVGSPSTFDIGKDASNKKTKVVINRVGRVRAEPF